MIIAFHKPYGVLCQFTREQAGQRTLAEFDFPAGVYPIGRLDLDSEGLLLLSDEPGFNSRLLDPGRGHERTYHAQVDGIPSAAAIQRLAAGGIMIKGHRTRPCGVRVLDPAPAAAPRVPPVRFRKLLPTSWVELTLTEGKNRQVRRMTAAVGIPTLRLIRVAIGGLRLGNLPAGDWYQLARHETDQLWSSSS